MIIGACLAAEFERVFSVGTEPCSLEHLETVAGKFALIPYENLSKIVRAAREMDPGKRLRMPMDILREFVELGAGGTCFSLTYCMQMVLEAYGYRCAPRMADLGRSANNHCALIVVFDDREYLLDPGYLITRPLPLPETGFAVHETRLHPVRLERDTGGGLHLVTLEPDGPKHRYHLHATDCDRETFRQYWIDSFSWNMMHSLLFTRMTGEGRMYLHDRHIRWMDRSGRRSDTIREDYDRQVAAHTGIAFDLVEQARSIVGDVKAVLPRKRSS
ncbi:arylamine N-acetyltransferase [bacterium]|nr:arylamine N-acetyltransferase [candidate division CSSED10-310 bacterium]